MRDQPRRADRRASIAVTFVLVLLMVAAGCGSGGSGAASTDPRTPSPEETMTTDLPLNTSDSGSLECGARFEAPPAGALTVTGRFPASVSADEQVVDGTVELVAKRSAAAGVVTPMAEAFLVREGRIVTLPMPQDAVGRRLNLAVGSAEQMPASLTLVPCAGEGVLATGTYDLYVRVVVNDDDGTRADSLGGPWPIELR